MRRRWAPTRAGIHARLASFTNTSLNCENPVINSNKSCRKNGFLKKRKLINLHDECDAYFYAGKTNVLTNFQPYRHDKHLHTAGSLHWLSLLDPSFHSGTKAHGAKIRSHLSLQNAAKSSSPVTQKHHTHPHTRCTISTCECSGTHWQLQCCLEHPSPAGTARSDMSSQSFSACPQLLVGL